MSHFKILRQSFFLCDGALSGQLSCMQTGLVNMEDPQDSSVANKNMKNWKQNAQMSWLTSLLGLMFRCRMHK